MDLGLSGRTGFVAAGSRGLGLAVATCLCREGADVGLCSRDPDAITRAAADLAAHGTRVIGRAADVTDERALSSAIEATTAETGRLDCLIVNAGGPPPGRFEELDDAAWRTATELTLLSAVHLVRLALPWLQRSDAASITFIGSVSVREPIDGLLLSNSLRAAVQGLAKTLSRELAPSVRVNSVLPDRIRTARTEALVRRGAPADAPLNDLFERAAAGVPLARYADPDEFARAVVFLASSAASFITGATLVVDGGRLAAIS